MEIKTDAIKIMKIVNQKAATAIELSTFQYAPLQYILLLPKSTELDPLSIRGPTILDVLIQITAQIIDPPLSVRSFRIMIQKYLSIAKQVNESMDAHAPK